MSEIIISNHNGEPVADSLGVAKNFDKRHTHVLDAIKELLNQPAEISARLKSYFFETVYLDKQGKKRKCYEITRDGFMLLAMGFSGQKAPSFQVGLFFLSFSIVS